MRKHVFIYGSLLFLLAPLPLTADQEKTTYGGMLPSNYDPVLVELLRNISQSSKEFKSFQMKKYTSSKQAYEALEKGEVVFIAAPAAESSLFIENKKNVILGPSPATQKPQTILITKNNFSDKYPKTHNNLTVLANHLGEQVINHLITLLENEKKPAKEVAEIFIGSLNWKRLQEKKPAEYETKPHYPFVKSSNSRPSVAKLIWGQIQMISIPFILALLIGIPCAPLISSSQLSRNILEGLTGVFFTIPPLVLLCFFIPSLGFGFLAVIGALFCHNILWTVKTACATSPAMGLSSFKILLTPVFLSKMRNLALFDISTTLLAGFLGGGGVGSMIALGLTLNDIPLILKGALIAAIMAMLTKWIFEGLADLAEKNLKRN